MSVLRVVFDENLVGVQETLEGIAECQAMPAGIFIKQTLLMLMRCLFGQSRV